jgi:hypothetical protein
LHFLLCGDAFVQEPGDGSHSVVEKFLRGRFENGPVSVEGREVGDSAPCGSSTDYTNCFDFHIEDGRLHRVSWNLDKMASGAEAPPFRVDCILIVRCSDRMRKL